MLDADAVKRRIEQQGRTRKWVAEFCGIAVDSLTHILNGRRQPSQSVFKLLTMALECPADELVKKGKPVPSRQKQAVS